MGKGPQRGGKRRNQQSGRVPFTNSFREQQESRGAAFKPGSRFSGQSQPNPHDAHVGKPVRSTRGSERDSQIQNAGRHANEIGNSYEEIGHRLLPDYIRPFPRLPGVDLISRDGTNRIEVKGTKNGENLGTFSTIKTLNGSLMNEGATQFMFITPTHAYLCDAAKLRKFIADSYKDLKPRQISRKDKRRWVTFSILDLINAKVITTPHGDAQGWKLLPDKTGTFEHIVNRQVYPPTPKKKPLPKKRKMLLTPEPRLPYEGHPIREGTRRRLVSRKRRE